MASYPVGADILLRLAAARAITACTALKITRDEMIRAMHEEHDFSDLFLKFLLEHSMRIQADLVDQLFNSSEKRLARILLLMAEFGKSGDSEPLIPNDELIQLIRGRQARRDVVVAPETLRLRSRLIRTETDAMRNSLQRAPRSFA